MGLFIGASIVSFVDMGEFLLILFYIMYKKSKRGKVDLKTNFSRKGKTIS